jgi:hypothetical protein
VSQPDPSPAATQQKRIRTIRWVAVLAAVGGVALATHHFWPRPAGPANDDPPDPRLSFDTPFRNVQPHVAYVGDAACTDCHASICTSYHRHPMGKSATGPDLSVAPATFRAFDRAEFQVSSDGRRVTHTEALFVPDQQPIRTTADVTAVIGSGTRGKSYVCTRDGSLWLSSVSWYSEKPGWDVSPASWPGRHVRRPIPAECVFCHVNHAEVVPDTSNRYREPIFGAQMAIGCERCHGPGSLHVAERTSGAAGGLPDTSVVNPKHLTPELREDVCRQCHLQGQYRLVRRGRGPFDFRPGLPLGLFLTTFVKHPALTDYQKSVGQFEQTAVSRCAAGSGGRFGCVSCHDPHSLPPPAEHDKYYRARCNACHAERGCSLPVAERRAKDDSCIACHMPKAGSSTIAHTAVTDHRILRRPGPDSRPKEPVQPGDLPITVMGRPPAWPTEPEEIRDTAVALARQPELAAALLAPVADRLREATDRHPRDVEAWEALSSIRLAQGNANEALTAAERALAVRPEREAALARAADAAVRAGKPDVARGYAERAVAANPGDPDHRLRLAAALFDEGKTAEAQAALEALLAMTPNHPQARAALAACLYKVGRTREALAELDRAAGINPPDGPGLRRWFSAHVR